MRARELAEQMPTVTTGDPVAVAVQVMARANLPGLIVVDERGDLVGVISRTDVVEDGNIPLSTLLRRRPSGLRVGELMTSPAVTVSPMTPLRDAARLMRDSRIHRLVAVDDAGHPIGVLSASDFVALYADG